MDRPRRLRRMCILGLHVCIREKDEVCTAVKMGSELLTRLAVGTRVQDKLYTWVFVSCFTAECHPTLLVAMAELQGPPAWTSQRRN